MKFSCMKRVLIRMFPTKGDLRDEMDVLKWLLHQKESDEIEDVTSEMLGRLVKESKNLAVLFCKCSN